MLAVNRLVVMMMMTMRVKLWKVVMVCVMVNDATFAHNKKVQHPSCVS